MREIGIDLGTSNVLIYIKGKGIVLNEPSVISIDQDTNKIIAYGKEAKDMIGTTDDNIKIVKPIQEGIVENFNETKKMLEYYLKKAVGKRLLTKPLILICCPSNITGVEKNTIYEIGKRLNARKVYVEEASKVAAIGAGIDITKASGSMIVDVGGGKTDIAILSLGEIVISKSIKIASNSFDEDIKKYIKQKYKLLVGDNEAENIKIEIATSIKPENKSFIEVTGNNIETNLNEKITITKEEVEEAIKNSIKKIVNEIKSVLEKTSPELTSDIKEKGIILTGGGSLINGLVEKIRKDLKIPVFLSDNPLTNVVEGTKIILDNLHLIDN